MNRFALYISLCSFCLFLFCGKTQQPATETKPAAQETTQPAVSTPTQQEARVFKIGDLPVTELVPGADSQLFTSENVMVSWLFMHPNMEFPLHNHPAEQIMIVREGSILQKLGDKEVELKAGDVAIIPSNLMHGGKVGPKGCKVIDIFYPIRKDYLEKVEAQKKK